MKRLIAIILFTTGLLIGQAVASQHTDVSGIILNENYQPIVAASVYLMTGKTGIIIKTAVTNELGEYKILKAPKGEFYIEVSSVGLANGKSSLFVIADEMVIVPTIILTANTQAIGEVVVQGQIPAISQKNGKLVMDVENSSLSAGNNALEIVKRAPGVSADQNDNLQLMGQSGINVTIDGRQTYMTGEQLTNFLKSTDGNQIKSVEVSTTRSARDDAEGTAGTINIVMKKNKIEGFNGNIVASAAQAEYFRGNSSVSLNYKKNNTALFGTYGYMQEKFRTQINIERNVLGNDGVNTAFDQRSNFKSLNKSHDFRFGIEQKTSKKNTMTLQFSGNVNGEDEENLSIADIGAFIGDVDSIQNASAISDGNFKRFSANFNNEFAIDTTGKKLTFNFDWSAFRNSNNTDYNNQATDSLGNNLNPAEIQRSKTPVDIDIFAAKLDYTQKLGKSGNLETGLKYSNVNSDNNITFENKIAGNYINDATRTNHFIYNEQILAGYLDYAGAMGKWTYKGGLRLEYTLSDGNSITENNRVKRSYPDLFPSASIGYAVNENNVLSLNYARKIQRPNYRKLNPFEYFLDKYTSERGNEYLKPQYTSSFSLNYTLYKMFNITAGYDYTVDAITETMGQDTEKKTNWVTNDNLATVQNSYLNINAPARIGKFWTMNNNVTGAYMYFNGTVNEENLKKGTVFIQANSRNTFKIAKGLTGEINGRYMSPFVYNIYKLETRWNIDLGTTYNFKDERSSLKLAVTDIFRTNETRLSTNFGEFDTKIRQYNDNRVARLTFTYKFGNMKQNIAKKNIDSDEKSRAL